MRRPASPAGRASSPGSRPVVLSLLYRLGADQSESVKEKQTPHSTGRQPVSRSAAGGSISRTVFPASGLVGLGGREPVAEGDGECVESGLPAHRPPGAARAGRVQGPGDQVEAL